MYLRKLLLQNCSQKVLETMLIIRFDLMVVVNYELIMSYFTSSHDNSSGRYSIAEGQTDAQWLVQHDVIPA